MSDAPVLRVKWTRKTKPEQPLDGVIEYPTIIDIDYPLPTRRGSFVNLWIAICLLAWRIGCTWISMARLSTCWRISA
jgi:hypothetical protein